MTLEKPAIFYGYSKYLWQHKKHEYVCFSGVIEILEKIANALKIMLVEMRR